MRRRRKPVTERGAALSRHFVTEKGRAVSDLYSTEWIRAYVLNEERVDLACSDRPCVKAVFRNVGMR